MSGDSGTYNIGPSDFRVTSCELCFQETPSQRLFQVFVPTGLFEGLFLVIGPVLLRLPYKLPGPPLRLLRLLWLHRLQTTRHATRVLFPGYIHTIFADAPCLFFNASFYPNFLQLLETLHTDGQRWGTYCMYQG